MNATVRNALLVLVGIAALGPVGLQAILGDDSATKAKSKDSAEVKLVPVKWKGYLEQVASHKDAKLDRRRRLGDLVRPLQGELPAPRRDAPEIRRQGLVAISLSLDEADAPKKVAAATKFLKEKKAVFTNLIMDETIDDAFDKLNIGAIPAVFIYTPDGKEIKRFTLEDVDNLFTYEQVEAFVKDYLEGKGKK